MSTKVHAAYTQKGRFLVNEIDPSYLFFFLQLKHPLVEEVNRAKTLSPVTTRTNKKLVRSYPLTNNPFYFSYYVP